MRMHKHNLSNYRLLTTNMGVITPTGLWEMLPTDVVQGETSMLVRLSPMAAPVMHPINVETFTFFCPMRLLWNKEIDETTDWETFITGGPNGDDASSPPTILTTGTKGDLLDHMGLPLVANKPINAMPIRAFNLIFNEWFRDQDLVAERQLDDVTLPLAAWQRDYFTTARPWTQKGPNVTLPLGGDAPVYGLAAQTGDFPTTNQTVRETGGRDSVYAQAKSAGSQTVPGQQIWMEEDPSNPGYPYMRADLANASSATINEVREAYAIQRFQEARAAWGSRYVEYLKRLGANPADARLQRPELIATGRSRVNISEVLQTAPETGQPPTTAFGVGDMYGHGITAHRANKFRKRFQENGYMLTMMVVRPRTLYQNGIDRLWLKRDKEEYFQRELQYIGQQNVTMDEIYADVTHDEKDIFGFQDRYREYRETPSKCCGDFRDTLNFWHLGRDFSAAPSLNEQFINCDATKRIFNVQSEDTLWTAAQHRITAYRQVAKNAVGRIL